MYSTISTISTNSTNSTWHSGRVGSAVIIDSPRWLTCTDTYVRLYLCSGRNRNAAAAAWAAAEDAFGGGLVGSPVYRMVRS